MTKEDIYSVFQDKIPTIVSYDPIEQKLKIGEEARTAGINNTTNMFNFKMDLFNGEKEFSENLKYWHAVTYADANKNYEMQTYSARQVTGHFLKELISEVDLPGKILIGEPAVREQSQKDNFRKNIRDVFADIGHPNIELFFEPFAVFQYYRFYEKMFPVESQPQIILVVDIGGGTFNSCIISTTNEGKLSRGGANMLPLGLQGEQCGGSTIDLELAKLIISKAKKKKVVWKDNPIDRAKSPILFRVEEAKIFLSDKIGQDSEISDDFENHIKKVSLPKGTLHPEKDISEVLTGNDLKKVIRSMWRKHYGKIITKTVSEAEEKLKKEIGKIDKVIIAGGSSNLPFMKQEILTVLPTLVQESDIYIGSDMGDAVACGIACECRELVRSRNSNELTVGTIAPCLLNDLYVGFKVERRGKLVTPKINKKASNGLLFSSPFEINETCMKFELELDIDISDRLFYYFNDQPILDDDPSCLNTTDYVLSLPASTRISKTFDLELKINENGTVNPIFHFRGKGSQSKKNIKPIECQEFYLDEKNIVEGDGFIGIDFGTSNSYLAKFISEKKADQEVSYPEFTFTSQVTELLRKKQINIEKLFERNVLSETIVKRQARKNKYLMIFHSNRIEGNTLSRGETEKVLTESSSSTPSKSQTEAINLEIAFNWVLENLSILNEEPENFIRHTNKLILSKIKKTAGEYRYGPVKITDMKYVPPPGIFVPEFMRELGEEIKRGVNDRSPLEFAASIHTRLVMIHPFEDGNGRTARLIMNAILLNCNLPLLIINYADKQRYFDGLIEANNGDLTGFLEFIIECYDSELCEVESNVFLDEKSSYEVTLAEENTKKDKVTEILGPMFKALMAERCSEQNSIKEDEYNNWSIGYREILKEVHYMVNAFNLDQNYKQLGLSLRTIEYDMLSFEQYLDLCKGKNIPRTWYFRIDVSGQSFYEKILFFFQPASPEFRNSGNSSLVNLCLARHDGSKYRRLKYEPVQLHEICSNDGVNFFLLNDDSVQKGECGPMISDYVLYDIVENYI